MQCDTGLWVVMDVVCCEDDEQKRKEEGSFNRKQETIRDSTKEHMRPRSEERKRVCGQGDGGASYTSSYHVLISF